MVTATNNDAILKPAGNKKLDTMKKAKITRSQKWSFTGFQEVLKCLFCSGRISPVSSGHTRTTHPDFANKSFRPEFPSSRINDHDLMPSDRTTAAHETALRSM